MGIELDVDKTVSSLMRLLNEPGTGLTPDEHGIIGDAVDNLRSMKEILLGPPSMFSPSQCSGCGHQRRAEDALGFCSKCGEHGPCAAKRENGVPSNNLFAAVLMPFHDGSGTAELLGVYTTKEKAEARCYRALKTLGYDQPTEIFESVLDEGCNE